MLQQELEFRGIKREHLGMYFEELGGKQITEQFPYIYKSDYWYGEILREEELSITSTFKVNSVHIRFHAKDDMTLKELIKNYRVKTRRIGG
ncbi:hypothetical protein [Neobacillus sp. DY30]|uniref:hypothetical protein n=1 Tax=Neobacillus sp. DY30 TaxID=3047871 RepID=UPI0024BFC23C|nr:hypothetical protein [Neobacillus sp. DY30]WHY02063.1 hypothetical protein QNH29_07485 [Neobacillus sp. DY30]